MTFAFCLSAQAEIVGLGVMGDSLSDEYFEETYGAYATNWTSTIATYRGINLGPTAATAAQPGGTWGEPRRTGHQYNWSRFDVDSTQMLAQGQHSSLANQVSSGLVSHAVLAIGVNDFHPFGGAYGLIYSGLWTSAQIDTHVAQTLTNIETALITVQSAGAHVVLVNILDYGNSFFVRTEPGYADTTKREHVTSVLAGVNTALLGIAQRHQVPVVDWFGISRRIFGSHSNLNSTVKIGNVDIHLAQADTNPIALPNRAAAFVADGVHPHTTLQSVLGNVILAALTAESGTNFTLLSEQEILTHAGLVYGGQDTLAAQIGAYSNYVIMPVRYPPGDVNGDSKVTGSDALLVNQVITGLRSNSSPIFATTGYANGDINRDNQVTGSDPLLLNQAQVGLRSYAVTRIEPHVRSTNMAVPVSVFGIRFPTNGVTGIQIGPPVSLSLTSLKVISPERIDAIVPAGGGSGTGMVSVIAFPSNSVISFGRFVNP